VALFTRLSALTALDLQGVTWLSDAVMTAIAAHCKRILSKSIDAVKQHVTH
jgi:hypothetical protein